jgi:XapX domain-containing protein
MKAYLVSFAVGLLVGVLYALLKVRSPAPPVIALVGLFGMLAGEHLPPLIQQALASASIPVADQRGGQDHQNL